MPLVRAPSARRARRGGIALIVLAVLFVAIGLICMMAGGRVQAAGVPNLAAGAVLFVLAGVTWFYVAPRASGP